MLAYSNILFLLIAAIIGFDSYRWYMILRCTVSLHALLYFIFLGEKKYNGILNYIMLVLVILFNPFWKFTMSRSQWCIVDIITAILLLYTHKMLFQNKIKISDFNINKILTTLILVFFSLFYMFNGSYNSLSNNETAMMIVAETILTYVSLTIIQFNLSDDFWENIYLSAIPYLGVFIVTSTLLGKLYYKLIFISIIAPYVLLVLLTFIYHYKVFGLNFTSSNLNACFRVARKDLIGF